MNAKELTKKIETIVNTIPVVHSFSDDSPYEFWNTQEVKYGSVCFMIRECTFVNDKIRYNCTVYYGDRYIDENDAFVDCQYVINQIIRVLEDDYDVEVISSTPVVTFFKQNFLDELAGGYANIQFLTTNKFNCGYAD